jgi:cytoskeleton protein RodZ
MATPAPIEHDVGRTLRRARHDHHARLEDAAEETRIPKKYLEALESNAPLDTYPAPMYARAFLREYARYLDLDPGPLLSSFGGDPTEVRLPTLREAVAPPRRWPARVLVAISICSLLGLAGLGIVSGRTPMPVAAGVGPGPAAARGHAPSHQGPKEPSGSALTGITVGMHVVGRCWVEATADGTLVLKRVLVAHWHRLTAKHTLDLTLGNAGGIHLMVNGKPFATGGTGQVLHLTFAFTNGHVRVTRA